MRSRVSDGPALIASTRAPGKRSSASWRTAAPFSAVRRPTNSPPLRAGRGGTTIPLSGIGPPPFRAVLDGGGALGPRRRLRLLRRGLLRQGGDPDLPALGSLLLL